MARGILGGQQRSDEERADVGAKKERGHSTNGGSGSQVDPIPNNRDHSDGELLGSRQVCPGAKGTLIARFGPIEEERGCD